MTDEARAKRDAFQSLIEAYGYKSIRKLCADAGVEAPNVYQNLYGTYDMSVKRAFKLSNALCCDVSEVIEVFHPDLYAENQKIAAESADIIAMRKADNEMPVDTE